MKVGILFSGGKDSTLALAKAMEKHEVACLITLISENPESYMFHVPNIHLTKMQSEAIGITIITRNTKGEKEKELKDLKDAIACAMDRYGIEGIFTGAVKSVYQSKRIKKICDELGLDYINPLWNMNEEDLLSEIDRKGYKVIVSGFFAYPMDKSWLGREIDQGMIEELKRLNEKFKISPAGEGGELETTVLDGPIFKKQIKIIKSHIESEEFSGVLMIEKAVLKQK